MSRAFTSIRAYRGEDRVNNQSLRKKYIFISTYKGIALKSCKTVFSYLNYRSRDFGILWNSYKVR